MREQHGRAGIGRYCASLHAERASLAGHSVGGDEFSANRVVVAGADTSSDPRSKPHVTIADGVVRIWFGPSEYASADVKLRQIPWSGPLDG
jgi:hypothetical protein